MVKLILASNSPRRKKIFSDLGLDFEVIPSNYEEKLETDVFSYDLIEDLATQKALDVVRRIGNNEIVIGADTVVILHNKILGKPKDKKDAFRMLSELSGNTHSVVTSICGINTKTNRAALLSTTSYVRFKTLSEEIINNYIEKFNPLDKAGSYGIQELPEGILDKYEGSFENIIGLAPESVTAVLEQLGYKI
ncbi:MAG: septum formation protein Maf [Cyanobacteria bacterium SIG28]|nr:septum formation protein Maf [Cyanobacteria bacterium SIG28]